MRVTLDEEGDFAQIVSEQQVSEIGMRTRNVMKKDVAENVLEVVSKGAKRSTNLQHPSKC